MAHSPEDAAFYAALEHLPPPPRAVPLRLTLALLVRSPVLIVGAFFTFIGLAISLAVLNVGALLDGWRLDDRGATAQGVVVGWEETNTMINEAPVIATVVEYVVEEQTLTCRGYQVDAALEEGSVAPVAYLPNRPEVCRVAGLANTEVPFWLSSFVLLFPLLGIALLFFPLRSAARLRRLLRVGVLVRGEVIETKKTNVSVDGDPLYKVRVRYTDQAGVEHEATLSTVDVEDVADDPHEPLLYDPKHPARVQMIDLLPDEVDLTPAGAWKAWLGVAAVAKLSIGGFMLFVMLMLFIMMLLGG